MANEFSATWFETFLSPQTAASAEPELEFIRAHLPLERFPRLLDVPCGIGRHAIPLARLGYQVLGIDRSEAALDIARHQQAPGATFECHDMNQLGSALGSRPDQFDGVLCLWSSFGYGTPDENQRLLADMSSLLRPRGRLVLDIYNPDALRRLPEVETTVRGGRSVTMRRERAGSRFRVHMSYSGTRDEDLSDWQVYTASELRDLAASVGLDVLFTCSWFDQDIPASEDHLRMQVLCERGQSQKALFP